MREGVGGVISGTAIVRLIEAGRPSSEVRDFVAAMKAATCRSLSAVGQLAEG